MPVEPTGYHQFWRAPGIKPWRPIVVTVLVAVAFFVVTMLVSAVAIAVEIASGSVDADEVVRLLDEGGMTPGLVLGNSIAIGLMIPVTLGIALLVKQRPSFLHSVLGRFRWRWFWACTAVSVAVLGVSVASELAITGTGELNLQIHPYTWWLLVGLVLATPFQAAAEEYLLRGVLFRTVASWFRGPTLALVVGTLVNAGIFMVMHGAADPWLNIVYFVLAVFLSWITWRTGGIEAAAAFHIVNNMYAFALVPFQDVTYLFDRSEGSAGPIVLGQLLASAVILLVIDWLARRRALQRLAPLGKR